MDAQVGLVRRFNRAVTQRIGALDDHYLSRDRPLGEARVLWEIGDDGCEVRALRSRLGLDSGYLSRLLRSLEADRLVTVTASDRDRRVRTAQLTKAGRAERAVLDRRSDALARSMLDALDGPQREQLVSAMATAERLLTAALVTVDAVDPGHPPAQHALRHYVAELDRRFAGGFDLDTALPLDLDDMRPPQGAFLVAMLRDEPVGCGGLKYRDGGPAELKRMWVAPSVRGLGIGRRLLAALEARAAADGCRAVQLDTNGSLTEAIAMYRSSGYREVPAFNDEPYADHWFEKRLEGGAPHG